MMPEVDGMVPNRWLSTLTINDYNSIDQVVNVINKLNENIETRALWKPLHLQPVFQGVKCITMIIILVCQKSYLIAAYAYLLEVI